MNSIIRIFNLNMWNSNIEYSQLHKSNLKLEESYGYLSALYEERYLNLDKSNQGVNKKSSNTLNICDNF